MRPLSWIRSNKENWGSTSLGGRSYSSDIIIVGLALSFLGCAGFSSSQVDSTNVGARPTVKAPEWPLRSQVLISMEQGSFQNDFSTFSKELKNAESTPPEKFQKEFNRLCSALRQEFQAERSKAEEGQAAWDKKQRESFLDAQEEARLAYLESLDEKSELKYFMVAQAENRQDFFETMSKQNQEFQQAWTLERKKFDLLLAEWYEATATALQLYRVKFRRSLASSP